LSNGLTFFGTDTIKKVVEEISISGPGATTIKDVDE
jgi:hypothetical protein